jgi:hypothetical protein
MAVVLLTPDLHSRPSRKLSDRCASSFSVFSRSYLAHADDRCSSRPLPADLTILAHRTGWCSVDAPSCRELNYLLLMASWQSGAAAV